MGLRHLQVIPVRDIDGSIYYTKRHLEKLQDILTNYNLHFDTSRAPQYYIYRNIKDYKNNKIAYSSDDKIGISVETEKDAFMYNFFKNGFIDFELDDDIDNYLLDNNIHCNVGFVYEELELPLSNYNSLSIEYFVLVDEIGKILDIDKILDNINKNKTASQTSVPTNHTINWDEYFMTISSLSALRSKDPKTKVGACIVDNDNKILSIGYNGFPVGCSDQQFPWNSEASHELDKKDFYVVHAELNAILNYSGTSLKNSKIYVSLFPCCECAKAIIQSGIKEVIFKEDKDSNKTKAAKLMFNASGVKYRQYKSSGKELIFNI